MSLAPGAWLNHYEILAHLGTGGMGEVYRARDNKLQREVALKVLPKNFAQDPERVARFRREAQVLAQLNHVNIAAIHSVEESEGTHFLVMELAEGETLRDRIKKGPVPFEESLDIVKQIAAGLEAAHEKPIVHRDLKPANVKVTPEGVVKILDFGLARAFAGDTGSSDPSDSPTLTAMTAPGTILGTAAYMSPEQARGRKVDKRTDIWALGCVLYELLTGQWPFQSRAREQAASPPLHPSPDRKGGVASPTHDSPLTTHDFSVADILGAVIHKDPDWSSLPATTPPNVRFVLRRCLEKDAKRRFHAATDVAIALEEPWTVPTAEAAPEPLAIPPRPAWQSPLALGLVALTLIGATSAIVWNLRPAPPPQPVSRLVIPLTANEQIAGTSFAGSQPMVALSPDGTHLAFVGGIPSVRGQFQLYLRAMDSLEARAIPGTEGALNPFFSPDGQWIGFFVGGALKKVSTSGGGTLTLAGATTGRGAAWGPNDNIVFAPTIGGLFEVPAAGGEPQELTTLKEGEQSHVWPQFLPDGKTILFTVTSGANIDDSVIAAQRLDTGEQRVLLRGAGYARYAPTGHLVYYRTGTIMAVPFDPDRLEVMGTPAPVLEGVMAFTLNPGGQYSFSSEGSLVYIPGGVETAVERELVWVDRNGMEEPLGAPLRGYETPRLSPDGRRIAFTMAEANRDIWVYEIGRQALSRFTFDAGEDERPLWTPDGMWLTFAGDRAGGRTLIRKLADGGGQEEPLVTLQEHAHATSWSPDGRVLAFETSISSYDVWMLPSEGDPSAGSGQDRKPTQFLSGPFAENGPRFSPDGRWIAYVSNESGRLEVYVQPYPGPGGKWQVSTEGGTEPVWARSGRELFYRNDNKMMAVEVATQPTFSPGSPRLLFEKEYVFFGPLANYDVSPDGRRLLMIKDAAPEQNITQINVVLNWFEELNRRVPVP